AMKTLRAPIIILGLLYFGLPVSLAYSAGELPERVATHFDASGQPNGWMSRHGHIIFIMLLGLALPLLVAGSFFCLRFFPGRGINLPHREYWLAPERRAGTFSYLLRHGLWFDCLWVWFM